VALEQGLDTLRDAKQSGTARRRRDREIERQNKVATEVTEFRDLPIRFDKEADRAIIGATES